jgi:hypothetical protein
MLVIFAQTSICPPFQAVFETVQLPSSFQLRCQICSAHLLKYLVMELSLNHSLRSMTGVFCS